jgi:outer membrane protein TolC
LQDQLGTGSIPSAPSSVAVGIPAELVRRRPDVRRAEREAASQSAQIGVAEADFYPQFSISGALGWGSQDLGSLFASNSFKGSVGPQFRWHILNYGRILNNVRFQDARFQELVAAYQQALLKANEEVENGLARFLESQEETRALTESVNAAKKSVQDAMAQYKAGMTDFNRVAVLQERLVQRQEKLAQAKGAVALGLVEVYRALGGGWQIRMEASGEGGSPQPELAE